MNTKVIQNFRIIVLGGLIILFLSVFFNWYSFQVKSINNELLVSWNYQLISEWTTPISGTSSLNEALRPNNLGIPFVINFLYLIMIIFSGYVVLFKNLEQADSLSNYNFNRYILGFLLLLNIFYIIFYPVMYLFPEKLYFPFLEIVDYNAKIKYTFAIGPGYLMQLIVFPFICPYIIFYFRTITIFEHERKSVKKSIDKVIESVQEPLDIDRLIAQEELKQQFSDSAEHPDDMVNSILTSFLEGEG